MKRIIAGAVIALSSVTACSQSSAWSLTEVPGLNNDTAGYIYHVYSRGNVSIANSKATVAAGLRFVCSNKPKNYVAPVIAIYWGGVLMSNTAQEVTITIDNATPFKEHWTHEGPLIYANAFEESSFIAALRKGRVVKFAWEGIDSSKYTVAFELRDFNLTDFNTSCQTHI